MYENPFYEPYWLSEEELEHFGVKGMKWGVRRTPEELGHVPIKKGVSIKKDGSISISKGVNLQRLSRNGEQPLGNGKMSYASVLEYDNARYIKSIAGKGMFSGGRDVIVSIKVKKDLRAPSMDEGCKLMAQLLQNKGEFRDNLTAFGDKISAKDLKKIRDDPTGKTAKEWYNIMHQSFGLDENVWPGSDKTKELFANACLKNGFNILRDENDVVTGLAKAPIILLDPKNTVDIITTEKITDELRKTSKETLKDYHRSGKNWIDKYLS